MKRKLRGCLLVTVGIIVCLAVVLWALITQPVRSRPRPMAETMQASRVDPDRLRARVRDLTENIYPRDHRHPENLDLVAALIEEEFQRAGGRVSEQPFVVEGRNYRNVIARFGPETDERIVIGAHYDTAGEQPGADDNASAVAGLIELVYLIGRAEWPLTVEAVAYSLEEPPFFRTPDMGSAKHAARLRQDGHAVRVMICLEMIGFFNDEPGSQSYPVPLLRPFYPGRGDYIAVIGKISRGGVARRVKQAMRGATPLPVYSINAPAMVPGIDFSDHLNYWNAGYDAVMITDTAFYRNPNYHEKTDTWDTLDYDRLALVVQGVYAAVQEFAR